MKHKFLLAAALTVAANFPAFADVVGQYNFTGVCSDCPDFGYGQLTVSQAAPNGPLSFAFSYNSDWISYTIANASVAINEIPFTGTAFPNPSGQDLYLIGQNIGVTSYGGLGNPLPTPGLYQFAAVNFSSQANGQWGTGVVQYMDFGGPGSGSWGNAQVTATPEPSSLLLIGAGAGLVMLGRRKRKASGKRLSN